MKKVCLHIIDYYPFGQIQPGRSFTSSSYRFGFNGMEKESDITGIDGGHLDFGARIYDSRLGRWLSLDPLQVKYPSLSPYNFVSNSPILFIDPDGRIIANPNSPDFKYLKSVLEKTDEGKIVLANMENSVNVIHVYVESFNKNKNNPSSDGWKRSAMIINTGSEAITMTKTIYDKMINGETPLMTDAKEGGTFDTSTGEYIFEKSREMVLIIDKDLIEYGTWDLFGIEEVQTMTIEEREVETITHESVHPSQTYYDPGVLLKKQDAAGNYIELSDEEINNASNFNESQAEKNYNSQRNEKEANSSGSKALQQFKAKQ